MVKKNKSPFGEAKKVFDEAIGNPEPGALATAFSGLKSALKREVENGNATTTESLNDLSRYAVEASEAAASAGNYGEAGGLQAQGEAFAAAYEMIVATDQPAVVPTDTSEKNVGQAKHH